MLNIASQAKVFLCLVPTDMRKSIDGLCGLASSLLEQDPLSGHLFVFVSKRRDRVKLLYWDATGYAVWYKRLEQGVFRLPARGDDGKQPSLVVSPADLVMLLDGVDLASVKRGKRFRLQPTSASAS